MMKLLILTVFLFGCQGEKTQSSVSVPTSASVSAQDDFKDLEELGKKDESCATEEEIKESFKPKLEKKPTAFKLQGGDPGCTTDAH